jgi:hypothetical protein
MLHDVTCYMHMHMHMHVHVHAHVYRGLHEAANSESKLQYECCSDPAVVPSQTRAYPGVT